MKSTHRRAFEKGALYMTASAGMLSLFSLFGKLGSLELPLLPLLLFRFLIPLLLALPFLLYRQTIRNLLSTNQLGMQFLRGGCTLVYQASLFYYLQTATLLDATVLQNTGPLFIPLFEWLFFKMKWNWKLILSILISFTGVLCILQPDKEIFGHIGGIWILATLGQAGSQVLYGHQSRNEDPRSNLFYFYFLPTLFVGLVYLVAFPFFSQGGMIKAPSPILYFNLLAMGGMSLCNQFFRGLAYKWAKPSVLVPFLYFSLIFSGFLDWLLFHHLPNYLTAIGAILVVTGGVVQMYHSRKMGPSSG